MPSIATVQPLHVAAWIEGQTRDHSAPTVKQQLAAIRHLFDWLVMGQVVPLNPTASVRGPAHSVRKGKTPVLDPAEARTLLDSIDVGTPIGLRDRALIALMVYSFGRIGGKRHAMPCHHTLEDYLHAYLDGTRIAGDAKGPLFRTIGRGTQLLTRTPLPQANPYAMVRRCALAAAICGGPGWPPQASTPRASVAPAARAIRPDMPAGRAGVIGHVATGLAARTATSVWPPMGVGATAAVDVHDQCVVRRRDG